MGLIFKRQTSGRKMAFERRVSDSQISNKYIGKVVKEIGSRFILGKTDAKKRFAKDLFNRTLTRENVHDALEKRIQAGDISIENAKKIQTELGVTEERFKKFDRHAAKEIDTKNNQHPNDNIISRNKAPSDRLEILKNSKKNITQEMPDNRETSKVNRSVLNIANIRNNISDERIAEISKQHSSVWEILNKKQHSDAFPDDNQKTA